MTNGPFEDVFPIENGDIPTCYVSLPEIILKVNTLEKYEVIKIQTPWPQRQETHQTFLFFQRSLQGLSTKMTIFFMMTGDSSLGSGWTNRLKQKQIVKLDRCPQSRGWNNWKKTWIDTIDHIEMTPRLFPQHSVFLGWPSNHGYGHSHLLQIHGSGNILSSCSCECRNKKEEGGGTFTRKLPSRIN